MLNAPNETGNRMRAYLSILLVASELGEEVSSSRDLCVVRLESVLTPIACTGFGLTFWRGGEPVCMFEFGATGVLQGASICAAFNWLNGLGLDSDRLEGYSAVGGDRARAAAEAPPPITVRLLAESDLWRLPEATWHA